MDNVKVSIILSAYNEEERWIRSAIESILNQSFTDFELILILDNPNNSKLDNIIKEYVSIDNRIIYIKNNINLGLVSSLNKGLKSANGNYIARMDADDIAERDRLKKQYDFMENNKNIDLIGTSIQIIDEDDNILENKTKVVKNSDNIKKYLKYTNVVVHPTFFFRKEVISKLEGYRDIHFAEDYDFICRLVAEGYNVSNLDEPLLKYRIRKNSVSRDKTLAQLYNAFYLKGLYKERVKTGRDSYSVHNLYSEDKIRSKDIELFNKSEKLKEIALLKQKAGNKLVGKIIFIYSKLISKYARKNAAATIAYEVMSKVLE